MCSSHLGHGVSWYLETECAVTTLERPSLGSPYTRSLASKFQTGEMQGGSKEEWTESDAQAVFRVLMPVPFKNGEDPTEG